MEPLSRRPIERTPARRPVMGGSLQRPLRPHPGTSGAPSPQPNPQPSTTPSLLKPPAMPTGTPTMDIRPTTKPSHPTGQAGVTLQPATARPDAFHHSLHPAHQQPVQASASSLRPLTATNAPAQAAPAHTSTPHPALSPHPKSREHPSPMPRAAEKLDMDLPKHHKQAHPTAHAGLVGFIVFLFIGALCLAPVLPGKIWDGAPGSSDSFSTGDQNLDCLTTLGSITTSTTYDHKIGFPVVYSYATTSQQSATCQGKTLHATGGHTSQFNPLGLLADTALAVVVAIITAKVWRKLRTHKD